MLDQSMTRRTMFCRAAALAGVALTSPHGAIQIPEADAAALVSVAGVTGVVASSDGWLSLRTGPGVQHSLIRSLPNGTLLAISATSGDWFKVSALGRTGWVNSWYVRLTGQTSAAISRGNPAIKRVALTFDCGSDLGYTKQILATLANHGVSASFGLTGAWMKANPDAARTIAARGFQLINHTLDHRSFTGLSTPGTGPRSPAKRLSQIQANESLIRSVTGKRTKPYWRPPYGDIDSGVLRDAGALGYTKTAMWTIDSLGWNGLTADEIYWRVMSRMVWGAIVLMHVGAASQDANALDRLISRLKSQGYSFATVAGVLA